MSDGYYITENDNHFQLWYHIEQYKYNICITASLDTLIKYIHKILKKDILVYELLKKYNCTIDDRYNLVFTKEGIEKLKDFFESYELINKLGE
ncbi:MAG: hypothetical protein ACOCP8_06315 [archaeon]